MSRRHQSSLTAGVLIALCLGVAAPLEGLAEKPRDQEKGATQSYGPKVAAPVVPAPVVPAPVAPAPEAGDGKFEKIAVMHGSEERVAYVHIPPSYNPAKPAPVMFGFHGGKGRVNGAKSFSRLWRGQFDSEMILVFLNGQSTDTAETAWVSRDFSDQSDVELVKQVLKRVRTRYTVDTTRVYAAGFSNGGVMTTMLACHASELFSGFAVVSQTVHKHVAEQCTPAIKRPVLFLSGTADSNWPGRHFSLSAMESVDWWTRTLGCSGQPKKTTIDGTDDGHSVQRWTYAPCSDVSGFEFLRVENGEHIWPGDALPDQKANRCTDIDGSTEVLDFFRRRAGL
jgi:polyhydroxybutyrate depolymerase